MPEGVTSTPLDTLWQAPALVSVLLLGEGLALVLALAPGAGGDRWVYFGLASLAIQWIALLALGGLYLLRHRLQRMPMSRVAWIALGLLMVSTWAIGSGAWLLLQSSWPMAQDAWESFLLRLSGITLVVGLLGLVTFQNHWRARQMALRAKQSELEALQARIRPHFLFNTLNTGAALVRARPGEADDCCWTCADLFRAALAGPREILLADEIALVRRYLGIEALRFGDRLQVEWSLPETLPQVLVPALSIQPLAENAIRHGIEPISSGGRIDIGVEEDADFIRVRIANDLSEQPVEAIPGYRIGLNSARERVRAMSGGLGGIEATVIDGRHVAIVSLPRHARDSSRDQ